MSFLSLLAVTALVVGDSRPITTQLLAKDHCMLQKDAKVSRPSKRKDVKMRSNRGKDVALSWLDLDMFNLADAAYQDVSPAAIPSTASDGGEWKRLRSRCVAHSGDTDCLVVYAKDDVVVISFRGSDPASLQDWQHNIRVGTTEFCSLKTAEDTPIDVHLGFVQHLLPLIEDNITGLRDSPNKGWNVTTKWDTLNHILQHYKTLYVTGHSLGGALAVLFAACANRDEIDVENGKKNATHDAAGKWLHEVLFDNVRRWINSIIGSATTSFNIFGSAAADDIDPALHDAKKAVQKLRVSRLYTFGAPAVSKQPLSNNGGVFSGHRVFVRDVKKSDAIPWLANMFGFQHPLMQDVRLVRRCVGKRQDPNRRCSFRAEDFDHFQRGKTSDWKTTEKLHQLHETREYGKRLKVILNHKVNAVPDSLHDVEADHGYEEEDEV